MTFDRVSIDLGGASRRLSADGTVFGMHASATRGGPPMIAQSSEKARPDDLAAAVALAGDLPPGEAEPPMTAAGHSLIVLEARFGDGSVRRYYRRSDQAFTDERLQQLEKILFSYRAGYW